MPEWLYEDGIGESRAVLVEDGRIAEVLIDWPDSPWRVGTVSDGRLSELQRDRGRAIVTLADGSPAILSPLPQQPLSLGRACRVEVMREPLPEGRRRKWPKVRLVDSDTPPAAAPSLRERIAASGLAVTEIGMADPDRLEELGWSELLQGAADGEIDFPGGTLLLALTPAMTLIDVDGMLPPDELAIAGVRASVRVIRQLGIGGAIGIDLPTLSGKADRVAAAELIDALLPKPFERTGVNGFGFVQIIRPRARRSIPEMLAADPDGAAARALLRRAERTSGAGLLTLSCSPGIAACIEARPDWLEALARRTGRPVRLQADAGKPRWGGDASSQYP